MKPLVLSKYVFCFVNDSKEHRQGAFLKFFEWINPLSIKVYTGENEFICNDTLVARYDAKIPFPEYGSTKHSSFNLIESFVVFNSGESYCQFITCRMNRIFSKENIFVVDKDIISSFGVDAQLLYALCCYKNKEEFTCNARILMEDEPGVSKEGVVDYEEYKNKFLDTAVREIKDSYDNGISDLWLEYSEIWKENKRKEKRPYPAELTMRVHWRNNRQTEVASLDLSDIGDFEHIEIPYVGEYTIPQEPELPDKNINKEETKNPDVTIDILSSILNPTKVYDSSIGDYALVSLPTSAGIYCIELGEDSYIGKAKSLRKRIRQHIHNCNLRTEHSAELNDALIRNGGRYNIKILTSNIEPKLLHLYEKEYISILQPSLNEQLK